VELTDPSHSYYHPGEPDMPLNSYAFIFMFLPVSLLGYYSLRRFRAQRLSTAWLVASSVVLYGWFNPLYLALMAGSISFNYALGAAISGSTRMGQRKSLLALAIAVNLLCLGYFKYANFFVENVNAVFGSDFNLNRIILPLAISFFTIQQIAFLVDRYRGQIGRTDFLDYCFFVTFFPKLIAGPIVRYGEMFPRQDGGVDVWLKRDDLVVGLSMFFIGLFKKVIIADGLASYVNLVFGATGLGSGPTLIVSWVGAVAFALQLYFDFSGYSDMAIGLGMMFGVRLPMNFHSPYKAIDAVDFWRRWHITLSRFLRDYVYIPLGGNRKGPVRRNINLMLTMLVGGLWHGAGWTFIMWGALHGLYLVISHAWRGLQGSLGWKAGAGPRPLTAATILVTFVAVTIAWVFFRADSVHAATAILRGMFGLNGVAPPVELSLLLGPLKEVLHSIGFALTSLGIAFPQWGVTILWISLLLMLCWFGPNSQEFMANYRPTLDTFDGQPAQSSRTRLRWSPNVLGAIVMAAITVLAIIGLTQVSSFIYSQF